MIVTSQRRLTGIPLPAAQANVVDLSNYLIALIVSKDLKLGRKTVVHVVQIAEQLHKAGLVSIAIVKIAADHSTIIQRAWNCE
jgi:hypothetical protein